MKNLLLGTAVSLTMAAGASAADLPVYTKAPPAWSWTGCYIGANVGGGWSQLNASDSVTGAALATINGSGVVGGGQVGCDYQFARAWVIGVEGEFKAANITGSNNGAASKIPWLTTATARLGYAVAPATLLYVRGGGAWSTDDITAPGTPNVLIATATDNRSGWTVGGGIEHRLWSNISGFVEYKLRRLRHEERIFHEHRDDPKHQGERPRSAGRCQLPLRWPGRTDCDQILILAASQNGREMSL
jgi:outer membrane immunogenic protein